MSDSSVPTRSGPRPRFLVVGAGIRGAMFAEAIAQNPDADLVAVCEPDRRRRDDLTERLGVAGYDDLAAALAAHDDLTAAVIATPDFAHREPALACLQAGLDLMIEKPLATEVDDAEAIAAAAAASGRRVVVGFENRWNPPFTDLHERLRGSAGGSTGRVVNQVANLNDRRYVPTTMLSWADRSSPAWFLMPHTLDLAVWLSGAEPVDVYARGVRRLLPGLGVETWDAITATFTMSDGSLLVLNSQWVLPESLPAMYDFRYELHTEDASYRLDIADSHVTHLGDAVEWPQYAVRRRADGRLTGGPIDMLEDVVALLNGADLDLPGVGDGLLATRAVAAVHASLESGRPVPVGVQGAAVS